MQGKRPPKVPALLRDRGTHLVKLYEACTSSDCEKRPSLEHVVNELSTNFSSMSSDWGSSGASASPPGSGEFDTLP